MVNARGTIAQWLALAGLSLLLFWGLESARVPAALLLGPMLVGILFGTRGSSVRVPRAAFLFAQGIVGCLIARSITADIVASVLRDWPAMLLVVLSTVAAGAVVAWLLGRYGSLPGASAAWGSSPGGASAMVSMAEEFGADPRIVAFMQYARVVCVVVTAAFVARLLNGAGGGLPAPLAEARPTSLAADALPIVATLALAIGGGWLGRVLRVPAGGLLGPMLIGAALHAGGLLDITIPEPLLAISYAGIGWYVGLRFTKPLLASLWRAVPQIVGASMVLIALGGVSAWLLIRLRHTDPLTAFLATTPGGIDSIAIMALGTSVDVGFVMALQTLRVMVVILTGAPLARFIARTSGRP